jgi:hypothetical protein
MVPFDDHKTTNCQKMPVRMALNSQRKVSESDCFFKRVCQDFSIQLNKGAVLSISLFNTFFSAKLLSSLVVI